jgi:hypothetical protein
MHYFDSALSQLLQATVLVPLGTYYQLKTDPPLLRPMLQALSCPAATIDGYTDDDEHLIQAVEPA